MPRSRIYTAILLTLGLGLAVGAPMYVARAAPHLAVYLTHPGGILLQTVPYLVCGVIWLPWRKRAAAITGLILSAVLFLASVWVYAPDLWRPGAKGGDMIALWYGLVTVAMTGAVLVGSAGAGLVLWLQRRAQAPE